MRAKFPVVLLLKDCKELQVYQSIAELQDGLEPTDVENQEYGGWDADACEIELTVDASSTTNDWLKLHVPGSPSPAALRSAAVEFARSVDFIQELHSQDDPIEYVERVEEWIDRQRWSNRPLWRRALGLPNSRP